MVRMIGGGGSHGRARDGGAGAPDRSSSVEPEWPSESGRPLESIPPVVFVNFQDFFEIEERALFAAMYLLTGNRHDAEELTQEAFLRIWERWSNVQSFANPTGYLYRTALNLFRMRWRRAAVAARRVARLIQRSDPIDAAESRHEIDRALATLPSRQRIAVVLTELLDMTSAEAAEAMSVKAATVRRLAQDGREGLRRALGDNDV
jgi:RNA polymerase sigma-70 factor, ECF subfamily